MEGDDSPYSLPRLPRPTTSQRPKTNSLNTRTLFNSPSLEKQSNEYDILPNDEIVDGILLRTQNPPLLAIRKTIKKPSNNKIAEIHRPTTGMSHTIGSQTNQLQSIISKRPLTGLKEPKMDYTGAKRIEKEIQDERNSIAFSEDLISYFSKHKDGRGHRFIYLNYAKSRKDPTFSPYDLVKVPFAEVKEEYFTMSVNGVTRVQPGGNTEYVSLDQWSRECNEYETIHKLSTFKHYFVWKPFRIWKKFVMKQRYKQIKEDITKMSPYYNPSFFKIAVGVFQTSCQPILSEYLLCLLPQKKYLMNTYKNLVTTNKETLQDKFSDFMDNFIGFVLELDADIRDPDRILVKNSDFPESNRYFPKLGELMVLEQKKTDERQRRIKLVHYELEAFAGFIRMLDYSILEDLVHNALECWRKADQYISQDMSSIFQIEISFNDNGEVVFDPSFDDLINSINETLDDSLATLDKLPRLLMSPAVRPHLREIFTNLTELFDDGPRFKDFADSLVEFSKIKEHIIKVITESFEDAKKHSQSYKEYFPIYETGKLWDPKDYLHPRGGVSHFYDLNKTYNNKYLDTEDFIYDPANQMVINFDAIRKDVQRFAEDQVKLLKFRACTVSGALYIDSRNLRSALTPIPVNSLNHMQNTLKDLMFQTVDYLNKLFKVCGQRLKKEPTKLEEFVDFCDFINRMSDMTPLITNEIYFIDELFGLFEGCRFTAAGNIEHIRSPLHTAFQNFKKDQGSALQMKDMLFNKFIEKLEEIIKEKERKLEKYHKHFLKFPTSLTDDDLDILLNTSLKAKEKIENMSSEIEELLLCQEILKHKTNDFTIFQLVMNDALYQENLFGAIKDWHELSRLVNEVSFAQIDINGFRKLITHLYATVLQMRKGSPNPILEELYFKVREIVPYIDQLEVLSNSKMQLHHWNRLFEECGQPNSYYGQIKIEELISLGILKEKDTITVITSTAQGESQLEAEFQEINNKWKEVEIPLLEVPEAKTDENILIGSITGILSEIADSQIVLYKMLQLPYVQGIKENVQALSSKLETNASILEEWMIFQKNWIMLCPIFASDSIKSVLPQCVNRFGIVKRRWLSLVRHTASNMTLFHICSFPALLEMLKENNNTIDSILSTIFKYLDTKREIVPRLYYLSNDEVMTMISTNDFSVINKQLVKLFMNIETVDSRQQDAKDVRSMTESQNFQRIKIYGLTGKYGDSLPFARPIQCVGPCENWINQLIEGMKISFRENLASSLQNFFQQPLRTWLEGIPSNIAIIALNVQFTNEIQECFNNFENDIRTFQNYRNTLEDRINIMVSSFKDTKSLDKYEIVKYSMILMLLKYHLDQAEKLSMRSHDISQEFNWKYLLHNDFNYQNNTLTVAFGDYSQEHGYEFYGNPKPFVFCQSSLRSLTNIISVLSAGKHALLTGGDLIGKTHLTKTLALFYGRPNFECSSYPASTTIILERMILGAIGSGSWLILRNIELQSFTNLAFIYDSIKNLQIKIQNDLLACLINGKETKINKNCRLIMTTTNPPNHKSTEIPAQLRSVLKPIGFLAPDMNDVIKTIFFSLGFINYHLLTDGLIHTIATVERIFSYLQIKSVFVPLIKIASSSFKMRLELSNAVLTDNIELNKDPLIAEQFVVARAIYDYFIHQLRSSHASIFFNVLHSNFPIFEGIDIFKLRVTKPDLFNFEIIENKISNIVKNEIENECGYLPYSYLESKVISLYHMLQTNNCIIITGEPNSGKTLIVDYLKKAYDEISKENENILPIKIYDIYHHSDRPENIFGCIGSPNQSKQNADDSRQHYGQLQSYLYDMNNYNSGQENVHRILRFNGPLTPFFVNFLTESFHGNQCRIGTFDTFTFDGTIHFIIETSGIENINPTILCNCAILPMRNTQIYRNIAVDSINCEVSNPKLIFNRLLPKMQTTFMPEEITKMENVFCQMAPAVVSFVFRLRNNIFSSESPIKINGGAVVLSDHMPYLALQYALYYFKETNCDTLDDKQLKHSFAFAFFTIFSNILEPMPVLTFDTWIRASFQINVPLDWVGFDVPDHFWNVFPRPCLQAMYHENSILVPLDFKQLGKDPYVTPSDRSSKITLVKDISVITAPFLPLLKQASILTKNKQNLLIYGPKSCGKSNFLNLLLRDMDDIIPIFMPITPLSNSNTALQFLSNHSPTTKKEYFMPKDDKTYAVIFDNIDPDDLQTLEFIRMIASSNKIPLSSKNDPKSLELVHLHNYFLIVVTEDIKKLQPRFITKFTPIQVFEPSQDTMKYIFVEIASHYGIDEDFVNDILKIAYGMKIPNFNALKLLELIIHMEHKAALTDKELEFCLRAMISEFNLLFYHFADDFDRENFKKIYFSVFGNRIGQTVFEDFLPKKILTLPELSYNEAQTNFEVKILVQQEHLLAEELIFHYSSFNTNNSEKSIITFYPYVINKYVMLQRAICYPSSVVFLKGETGTGKRSLARFVTLMKGFEFFELPEVDYDVENTIKIFSKLITTTVDSKNPVVAFIRVTNNNKFTFSLVENLMKTYNFSTYFSDTELINLYQQSMKVATNDSRQKLQIYSQIKDKLMMKLRFFISVDQHFCTAKYSQSYTILFELSETKDLEETALATLSKVSAIEKHPSLHLLFSQIHSLIVPKFARSHPNQYIDFLNTFSSFVKSETVLISNRNENNKLALDYLSMIEATKNQLKKEIDKMEPLIADMRSKTEESQKEFNNKKEAIGARLRKIEEHEIEIQEDLNRFKEELEEVNKDIAQDLTNVSMSSTNVVNMKEDEILKLQSFADNPPNQFKKLICLICVLLGLSDDYEISGKDLLQNKSFFTILKQIDHTSISVRSLGVARKFLTETRIDKEELKAVSISAFHIYVWVMDVYKYAVHANEIQTLETQIAKNTAQLEQYKIEASVEKDSIMQVQNSLEKELKGIMDYNGDYNESAEKLEELKSDFDTANTILSNLDSYRMKLHEEVNEYGRTQKMITGNSVLFAAFIVYCGAMEQEKRIQFLKEVCKILEAGNLTYTDNDPLVMISSKLSMKDTSRKSFRIDKFLSQDTQRDCRHIKNAIRTPLIIDIDGLVTEHLISTIKVTKLARVSMLSNDFEKVLAEALENGRTLIVDDVNYLHPLLELIFPLLLIGNNISEQTIKINGSVVKRNPKFKLYLFTSERARRQLPMNLIARVTLIKTTFNSSINLMILTKIFEKFYPEKIYVPTSTDKMENRIESLRLENDMIDFMAEMYTNSQKDDDYVFSEDEMLSDMLGTKEQFLQMNQDINTNQFLSDKKEEIKFHPFVETCRHFWHAISRYLPKIGIKQHFSIANFMNCVNRAIELATQDIEKLVKCLISSVFQTLCKSLLFHETVFTMFIISFFMRVQEGKCKASDLEVIINHCILELNGVVDLKTYESLKGDPVEQLKFANVANVYNYISQLIYEYIGEFEQFIYPFKSELFISDDPQRITLIRTTLLSDCTENLVNFVSSKSRGCAQYFLLYDDDKYLENIKNTVFEGMKAGHWITLFYTKPSVKSSSIINQICDQLSLNIPSPDFRLIIVAEDLTYLPIQVLKSKCYAFSAFPSIRNQMEEIYMQHGHLIRSSTNPLAMKRIIFMSSLLLTAINFRELLCPAGFVNMTFLSPSMMKEVIGIIKNVLDLQSRDIPFKNIIENYIQNLFGRSIVDTFDYQKVKNMIHFMICPELMIPNFNFTSAECWQIPDETQSFEQLPVISDVDILLMEEKFGTPLRNWNLSRMIIHRFNKLKDKPNINLDLVKPKLESILVSLPSVISTSDESKFGSPIYIFLLSEIERYNATINEVKKSLINQEIDVCKAIVKEKVPERWKNMCGYSGVTVFTKFITYLRDKNSILILWMKDQNIPHPIDIRFICNIKGLFLSFLAEESIRLKIPMCKLKFEYTTKEIIDESINKNSILSLSNISVMCGSYRETANSFVDNSPNQTAFSKMPTINCTITKKKSKLELNQQTIPTKEDNKNKEKEAEKDHEYDGMFRCPLFKSIPTEEFSLIEDFQRNDGEIENFIQYIYLPTDEPEWRHIANGTSLICHTTDNFS
ncbi:Dynein heavy chain family protein [Tritrichomonas foetus]|uniref:Dynein heavy chain family protein n=1 Tax=Tritrichomonas foetus TaxID=1144522 RepID=A0A1J4JZ84_9EUKA|nr:Dynein heavy chain family protein [Tritrichomonas foetus]|eukprot:OHT04291.1 Dynein heavy chain family protein [Tritrichomonas foetus]